jgi:arylsulfotransferase ASST
MPPPVLGAPLWSRRRFLVTAATATAGVLSVGAVAAELTRPAGGATGPSAAQASRQLVAAATGAPFDDASPSPSVSAAPAASADRQHFRSRPDLTPPNLHLNVSAAGTAPGLVFFTPANGAGTDGPTIVDGAGELVWLRPDNGRLAANLSVATYLGEPVLTWWEGTVNGGNGDGEFVIADTSYTEMHRIRPQHGYAGDLHEFVLTPQATALYLCGTHVASSGGGPGLWDDVIQEVDVRTGRLLFEWHAAEHVDVAESDVAPPTAAGALYDYIHANSIALDADGDLLVSARNTSTVYKVDRASGAIRWRLGGKRSDFAMGTGTRFAYQHDARRQADGTITLFDDQSPPATGKSRAIVLLVDEERMVATLVSALAHPAGLVSSSQGNAQRLPNGNTFVGWGAQPYFSEFGRDGTLLFDATFPTAVQSYRSYRFPWSARPTEPPAVAALAQADGSLTVYASWNGATDVAAWAALAGSSASTLELVGAEPRSGFETAITVRSVAPVVAVQALDASGRVIAASLPIDVTL